MSKNSGFANRDRLIELGITIAFARKLRGMSQEQLAEKAGIRGFSVDMLFSIADALNLKASDLLENRIR